MDYITHNQRSINIDGTHGQGTIHATYKQLVTAFGQPLAEGFDDYKSDAEWHVLFSNGLVVTIYNWKNGRNYCGDEGTPTELITDWNIGSSSRDAIKLVGRALGEALTKPHPIFA